MDIGIRRVEADGFTKVSVGINEYDRRNQEKKLKDYTTQHDELSRKLEELERSEILILYQDVDGDGFSEDYEKLSNEIDLLETKWITELRDYLSRDAPIRQEIVTDYVQRSANYTNLGKLLEGVPQTTIACVMGMLDADIVNALRDHVQYRGSGKARI